jgi:hypothetical protein
MSVSYQPEYILTRPLVLEIFKKTGIGIWYWYITMGLKNMKKSESPTKSSVCCCFFHENCQSF